VAEEPFSQPHVFGIKVAGSPRRLEVFLRHGP
jgi:hypothetical protein